MKINWKVLDPMLLGEANTDDVTVQCREEIFEFVQTHNFDVFSEESLSLLSGIFELAIRPNYEYVTKSKIPNIFESLRIEEEAEEETEDERQALSSRFE